MDIAILKTTSPDINGFVYIQTDDSIPITPAHMAVQADSVFVNNGNPSIYLPPMPSKKPLPYSVYFLEHDEADSFEESVYNRIDAIRAMIGVPTSRDLCFHVVSYLYYDSDDPKIYKKLLSITVPIYSILRSPDSIMAITTDGANVMETLGNPLAVYVRSMAVPSFGQNVPDLAKIAVSPSYSSTPA